MKALFAEEVKGILAIICWRRGILASALQDGLLLSTYTVVRDNESPGKLRPPGICREPKHRGTLIRILVRTEQRACFDSRSLESRAN